MSTSIRDCRSSTAYGKQTLEQFAEVVAAAEARGIPLIADAAIQLPPRSNLTEPVRLVDCNVHSCTNVS